MKNHEDCNVAIITSVQVNNEDLTMAIASLDPLLVPSPTTDTDGKNLHPLDLRKEMQLMHRKKNHKFQLENDSETLRATCMLHVYIVKKTITFVFLNYF
jgi:hypothetical protein